MATRVAGQTPTQAPERVTASNDLDFEHPARTNACAIIALLCALLVLALPAFVFGIIGMRQTARRDEEGWGMAFAGVIIGGLELIVGAGLLGIFGASISEGVALQW
ncbi:DUF4190 domain-containing protein [Rhodococcus sp. NPDC004095]